MQTRSHRSPRTVQAQASPLAGPTGAAPPMTRPPPVLVRPSPVALWQQIAQHLRAEIHSGAMPPGHRLPAEPELGAMFAVSRITVRKAIEALVAEAVLTRSQGKGTFVNMPVLRHELSELTGIIGSLQNKDVVPRTTLVEFAVGPAPPRIAERLGIGNEDVLYFRRLYDLDGVKFGLAEIWMPGAAAITRKQVSRATAYEILATFLGITAVRADVVIRAKRPDLGIHGLLDLPRRSTLLHFERTSRSLGGTACEHTIFWVRAESYEFHLSLNGPMPIGAAVRTT